VNTGAPLWNSGAKAGDALCFRLPVLLMRDRDSKCPFVLEEMYGYAKEKALAKLHAGN